MIIILALTYRNISLSQIIFFRKLLVGAESAWLSSPDEIETWLKLPKIYMA